MNTSPTAAAITLPPNALNDQQEAADARWTPGRIALWAAIALMGAAAWSVLAISRGETINAVWFVLAAVCTYLVGYRFYSKMIERRVAQPDDSRATPAEYHSNGRDYVPTDRVVLFGHHFAAIAGAGPLVGPVLAAQMGYLPGTIWIVVGAVLAGCVQDYLVLFFSMRRGGRSLGQMAREELGVVGGTAALAATLAIMIIIVAILALVVVNALGESPWGVYSVSLTIPILVVQPEITAPAFSEFAGRADGPVVPGSLFPFLFVTIACGALSGFHALISSGTTPKLVEKEKQTRFLGYGGMLMESLVAIMALVAAISIDRGIYFAMNVSAASTGGTVDSAVAFVNSLGLTGVHLTPDMLTDLARNVGEPSIISRTGGAPTLSVGIAHIMHQWFGGTAMMGFWYHFAIMFEALFILTAVDAGTRVARFMLQDTIGNFFPKFKDTSWKPGAWLCTAIMVAGWGYILVLGVTDPLGGINTFFPLFGIANQLLAAIALAVVMAIVAKRGNFRYLWVVAAPLVFIAVITIWASWEKIFSDIPAVSYWAQHEAFKNALAEGKTSFGTAHTVEAMQAVVHNTFVQGSLSIVFVVLALIVMGTAVLTAWRAYRKTHPSHSTEDPRVESRLFAPAGLLPTPSEKALLARWEAAPSSAAPAAMGH
ncbi:carbon starvation CstA family protein [Castellaniella ginsengisoli]|uniref:Carbon starvation CstA family protein n=1 Tax=Castellaniella ginsengisoli TaxID=546114 RepID=A0AB39D435_9BURK